MYNKNIFDLNKAYANVKLKPKVGMDLQIKMVFMSDMINVFDIEMHYRKLKFGDRLQVPVVRLISMARCRCPNTLNWGSDTSLETPTEFGPSFHLYRISRIV